MGDPEDPGPRQEHGGEDRQDQAGDGQHFETAGDAPPEQIRREAGHHHDPGREARHQEPLVPEPHGIVVDHRLMHESGEPEIDQGSQAAVDTQYAHAQREVPNRPLRRPLLDFDSGST